jgi:hypothetical protein
VGERVKHGRRSRQSVWTELPFKIVEEDGKHKCFWSDIRVQRKFLENILLNEKKWKTKQEWYRLSVDYLLAKGAGGLLQHYDHSIVSMLTTIFPEFPWKPELFVGNHHLFVNSC